VGSIISAGKSAGKSSRGSDGREEEDMVGGLPQTTVVKISRMNRLTLRRMIKIHS
jgi:hypothetical protein